MLSEFEKVAYLLAVSSDNVVPILQQSALQRINQQDGGFRVDYFEYSIERWITMWEEQQSKVPCIICAEYLPAEEYNGNDFYPTTTTTTTTTTSCRNTANACMDCLRKYCRIEMLERTPVLWEGIRCFCGCGETVQDSSVQVLFETSKELKDEYDRMERKLRHRRISSDPHYRFCPNPKCSEQLVGTSHVHYQSTTEVPFEKPNWTFRSISYMPQFAGKSQDELRLEDVEKESKDESKEESKEESKKGSKKEVSKQEQTTNLLVNGVAVINTKDVSNGTRCWRCCEKICIRCGASAHNGSECEDAHEASLNGVADNEGWVRCTKCRHLIQRMDGCDHMTCHCGAEFCFCCGAMPHCGVTCKKEGKENSSAD
jgi:hypothetical protein